MTLALSFTSLQYQALGIPRTPTPFSLLKESSQQKEEKPSSKTPTHVCKLPRVVQKGLLYIPKLHLLAESDDSGGSAGQELATKLNIRHENSDRFWCFRLTNQEIRENVLFRVDPEPWCVGVWLSTSFRPRCASWPSEADSFLLLLHAASLFFLVVSCLRLLSRRRGRQLHRRWVRKIRPQGLRNLETSTRSELPDGHLKANRVAGSTVRRLVTHQRICGTALSRALFPVSLFFPYSEYLGELVAVTPSAKLMT